jgi:hypothetical protein
MPSLLLDTIQTNMGAFSDSVCFSTRSLFLWERPSGRDSQATHRGLDTAPKVIFFKVNLCSFTVGSLYKFKILMN